MVKNFALAAVIVLLLILFSTHIKEGIFDARVAIMMSRIDIEEEAEDRLREVLSGVGDGYRKGSYTQVERIALEELVAEVRSYQGKELPTDKAKTLSNRFQIITDRHGL